MDVDVAKINITKFDYILVFLLLCFSGNLFVCEGLYLHELIVAYFVFSVALCFFKKNLINKNVIIFFIGWLFIFSFQLFFAIEWTLNTVLFMLMKYFVGIVSFSLLGRKLPAVYLRVIFFLSFTSLFFYCANCYGYYFKPLYNGGDRNSIFIYTQLQNISYGYEDFALRNSSMFWEPGAFQGFINMVFIFYLPNLGELWEKQKKMVIVIVLALITTFSTTGYLVFFTIIYSYLIFFRKWNDKSTFFMVLIVSSVVLYLFFSLDFLSTKIGFEGGGINRGNLGGERMNNLKLVSSFIEQSPLLGYGYSQRSLELTQIGTLSNGWGAFIFYVGFIGFIYYYIYLIYNLIKQKINMKWLLMFLIVNALLLQGEGFLSHPFFMALPFALFVPLSKSVRL